MTLAYFPGCSLHSTGAEYDQSFRLVSEALGIELAELGGWICCGSAPAHSVSRLLSLALPLQNLCLAQEKGFDELVAPCAACFSRFRSALHDVARHPELKDALGDILDAPFPDKVRVSHPLEVLTNGFDLANMVKADLSGLKVVCYYGCETRPAKVIQFDDGEYPMSMDNLLRSIGIETLDWSYKSDCCGGSLAVTETEIVVKLTREILEDAKAVGADAIAVACPLCHTNLDTRQAEVEEKYETDYGLPIVYFTQLLGLALGLPAKRLGLYRHLVSTEGVLQHTTAADGVSR